MSRLLPRAVRLVKFGAVAGALVGVGRLVMQRRRKSESGESSWPTIAETAAENGEAVDAETDAESPEAPANDGGSDAEQADGASDETGDDKA